MPPEILQIKLLKLASDDMVHDLLHMHWINCIQNALTYKTGLCGAKHSNWTIFVVVPVTSASSWQAAWHVEIGANVTAYTNTNEKLTREENTQVQKG